MWRTTQAFVDAFASRVASGAPRPATPPAAVEGEESETSLALHFPIKNAARSVGARLSGEMARRVGPAGFPEGTITLNFHGVAGQSFGAFCNRGMRLVLRGEAHDYVGKSMYGGAIVLSPQATPTAASEGTGTSHSALAAVVKPGSVLDYPLSGPRTHVIAGNTCLYGATGGRFFAAGRAGQRFAVRNSGATAVVEGAGDHACEYMTNGTVVVLGSTGRNFGAGMSGGEAFVLDLDDSFLDRYNPGMIEPARVGPPGSPEEARLRSLVEEHVRETGSPFGRHLLAHWHEAHDFFWHVVPNATPAVRNSQALVHVPNWSSRRRGLTQAAAAAAAAGGAPLQQLAMGAAAFSSSSTPQLLR